MHSLTDRHTISLVVRLWQEPGQTDDPPFWRGQIQEVASGETSHFQLSPLLIDFMTAVVESHQAVTRDEPPPTQ